MWPHAVGVALASAPTVPELGSDVFAALIARPVIVAGGPESLAFIDCPDCPDSPRTIDGRDGHHTASRDVVLQIKF
jgi:hypothetical protein